MIAESPTFGVMISPLLGFPVQWNWGGSDTSVFLAPGQRLVIPGMIARARTEWGNQKWQFLGPQTTATRQRLRVMCEADGPLLVQRWTGYDDVTNNTAIALPVIGKIYTGNSEDFVFEDETTADFAILNNNAFNAKITIEAIFDAPLIASGLSDLLKFENTVWSGFKLNGTGQGSFLGNRFNVSLTAGGYVEARGDVQYTGIAQHCQVVINTTATITSSGGLFVQRNGSTILTITTAQISAVGQHVFTFTVAQSVAATISIIGLTDIADPNRLFIFSGSGAYNATFSVI